jgi:hypothetical protein
VAAVNELIRGAVNCQHPRPQLAYIAPFRDQAKRVAWDYLKHYSEPVWDDKPNESELSVKLMGGAKMPTLLEVSTLTALFWTSLATLSHLSGGTSLDLLFLTVVAGLYSVALLKGVTSSGKSGRGRGRTLMNGSS